MHCFSFAQDTAHWFTIKAFLPQWNGCEMQLKIDGEPVETGTIANDMYSYIGTVDGIHHGWLQLKKDNRITGVPLFIEKGTIKITDKGYNQLLASGTPANDAYQNLVATISATALRRYGYDYERVNAYKKQWCIQYIQQHRASLLSLQLLKYYPFTQPGDSLYRSLYQSLDTAVKNTYLGRQMGGSIQHDIPTAVGEVLTNLSLPDTLQQETLLYENDAVTLVDFWASWCAPCRQQNRELVKLFDAYHNKGFAIVSVSLDTDKDRWLYAVKRDGLAWKQLSDLKGWESAAAKTFHITAVPMNVLIDSGGHIIARNVHPTALRSLLAQRLP